MFESFLDGLIRSFLIVIFGFLLLLFLLIILPLFLLVWIPSHFVYEKTNSQIWAGATAYLIIATPFFLGLVISFKEEGIRGPLKLLGQLLLIVAVAGVGAALIILLIWYFATWGGQY